MSEPEFYKFTIHDQDDANQIHTEIDTLVDYVQGIGTRTRLTEKEESILRRAKRWIAYAVRELNMARVDFVNINTSLWSEVHDMLDLLRNVEPKIKRLVGENDRQKMEETVKE
ncbi:hypothetical protein F5Y11DRAFT_348020 [Daldinia sp. FL1419]|nr:hypothetical protein F5Y11DRAFT_348020 [Daldinia sp. FL1419]